LAELTGALGAKIVVYGNLSKSSLVLKVWDVAGTKVAGAIDVRRAASPFSASALGTTVDALLVPVLSAQGLSIARTGRAPTDGLALPRDPTQQLRALLRGQHHAAGVVAQGLPAARRPLAQAAVQIASGDHATALASLKAMRGDNARKNELVSAVVQADRALAARVATDVGGQEKAKALVQAEPRVLAALEALLTGAPTPAPTSTEVASALAW